MNKFFSLLVALAGLLSAVCAQTGPVAFRADLPAGTACTIDARQLHPTQFSHGWREVVHKQAKMDAMSPTELKAYLIKKDVPVVIGPGGVPYLTDGHHTLRSLIESKHADKTAYGHILANWSDLAPAEFWARMQANNYAYLKDGQGRPQPASALPASLLAMQRDPWRGLAWGVMETHGFHERKDVFFQEFRWADYFRDKVAWDEADDEAFEDAVKAACVLAQSPAAASLPGYRTNAVQPRVITEPAKHDTDDPAIWINRADLAKSLVIGTDKNSDGALLAYDLAGKIVHRVTGLKRPNNVDLATGFPLGGRRVDIAVVTEREQKRLRVFTLPDLAAVDRGDLVVFNGDPERAPMGVALYQRPRDGAIFAIVGGKSGPAEGYLAQYRLEDDGTGQIKMTLVRQFGAYSGRAEIEAIGVDAELGYVYYSDETFGVRKYAADPDAPDANRELALFGTTGFASDHEGISIYPKSGGQGYVLVSDQQAYRFQIFPRAGTPGKPHDHPMLAAVEVAAIQSDGSDVTPVELPGFPGGLFVAMTEGKVFHFYAWADLAKAAGLE
ncbi:phytase [Oleiharenicola lentus]|uniref:Phytase n=1 Tax=Oleiharenicola lentus TaxID=2508720 RepID=A0A4Q1C7M9_9BACT|nr:phytase [Oleiharenicola lentus]RXK54801.1 phytase [Oleiharenicola lentus]